MSVIKIVSPAISENHCTACINIQMVRYRNKIKKLWNELRDDGKMTVKELIFNPDPDLLLEFGVTIQAGNLLCLTHAFNTINAEIEAAEQRSNGPSLQVAQGPLPKSKLNLS